MKNTIVAIAVGMSTLVITPVFAGNEGTSLIANVEVVAGPQELALCINNAKSEGFNCNTYVGCSERKSFVASCMSGNDAKVQYASLNREIAPINTRTAVTDYNKLMQEAPTAAGNK